MGGVLGSVRPFCFPLAVLLASVFPFYLGRGPFGLLSCLPLLVLLRGGSPYVSAPLIGLVVRHFGSAPLNASNLVPSLPFVLGSPPPSPSPSAPYSLVCIVLTFLDFVLSGLGLVSESWVVGKLLLLEAWENCNFGKSGARTSPVDY
jgi:hypothetical protein